MRWLRWNWLDQGLLPLLLAIIRFCWLWPWLLLLRQILAPSFDKPIVTPGWIIVLPLVSLLLSYFAPVHELPKDKPLAVARTVTPWWARSGIALAGLLVILLALWWHLYRGEAMLWDWHWLRTLGFSLIHWPANEVPAAWLAILALVYLWLRGMLDAAQPMAHDDLWGAVLVAIISLVGCMLLARGLGLPLAPNLGNLVVLLFAAAMVALAVSSLKTTVGLDYALGLGQRPVAKAPQASRYWLSSVAVVVAALLGIGVGVGLLVAPAQVAQLLALVNKALGIVWWLLGWVILILSYIIFMAVYYLLVLLQPLFERLMALLTAAQLLAPQGQPQPTPTPDLLPPDAAAIPDVYRWLALALFVVAVAVIFALVLRKLRSAPADTLDETRESILSAGLLQDQLAKLWQKWFGRLAGERSPFLSLDEESETRRIIRQAYQGLLARAVQPRGRRLVERLDGQRRLAPARHTGHADELAQRKLGGDVLEVVAASPFDHELLAAALAP
ncbi:MAG TPA: hypothetical protein PKE45_01735, partial [Caldilineaceae bacterium]|nr:hypothetical protein [Caldilineaceae bacterium]